MPDLIAHATPLEVAAARKLVGLTHDGLAELMHVNPRTIRSWESGRDSPSETAYNALMDVVERHDREFDKLREAARGDEVVRVPRGPLPTGWYVALAARVMDAHPGARFMWDDAE